MSPPYPGAGPYRLVFTPEAQAQCQRLPSRQRGSVERTLARLARTVGLRQYVSPSEAMEEFQVHVAAAIVSYELDPGLRALVVKRVETEGR
ncbi:hypothetical protein [Pyxidicoccus xibeiensis]|uniref:hypothetical protein n=1 Tax=Pyxidicoccus xibeiensis TaxID=2906759 RepID=UPI0020A7F2DB|nr:hypothetical protein [Pyxidicoccus xibeiensis]MCP3139774.1 hypothetical protein [Pyxidicoccus xibeiensis]